MKDVDYSELPEPVKEVTDEDHSIRQVECAHCETTLYDIRLVNGNDAFVNSRGNMPGSSAGFGGIPIEDQGALPRQTKPENGIFLCGSCADVDEFERHSEIHGVTMTGSHFAALVMGSIIDNHYITQSDFQGSVFEEAFEQYARDEDLTLDGESMVSLVSNVSRGQRDRVHKISKKVLDGQNPFDFDVVAVKHDVFVPESKIDEVLDELTD